MVAECERAPKTRGWCDMHYRRWLVTGDPLKVRSLTSRATGFDRRADLMDRFLNNLEVSEELSDGTRHLLFTGPHDAHGYGHLRCEGRLYRVHRLAWEIWVGPIPQGHEMDHLPECPKNCVNPAHLTPLTKSEHTRIGFQRGERKSRWVTEPALASAAAKRGVRLRWGK